MGKLLTNSINNELKQQITSILTNGIHNRMSRIELINLHQIRYYLMIV